MNTHYECTKCKKLKPEYRFIKNEIKTGKRVCNPCKLLEVKEKFKKKIKGCTGIVEQGNPICMSCKKPMNKDIKGGYHVICRKQRNAKTDTGFML